MGFLDFPRNVFNAAIDVPVHFVTHFTDDLVERTRARPHPPRNFPERYYGTHAPGEIPHPWPVADIDPPSQTPAGTRRPSGPSFSASSTSCTAP